MDADDLDMTSPNYHTRQDLSCRISPIRPDTKGAGWAEIQKIAAGWDLLAM